MVIFKTAGQIASFLSAEKNKNKTIGFVPTMGALHNGHRSLIEACKLQNDVAVCSVFINPVQFNNQEDFKHYPVSIEKDVALLLDAKCDVMFLPSVAEMYPAGYEKNHFLLGKIESVLEGQYRPGHFQGVCQVMERLLAIISPHNVYLGQKDYQQCIVIKKLIQLLGKENEYHLIVEPTVREVDGLAMSSRNLRLSKDDRLKAPALYNAICYIKNNLGQQPFKTLKRVAKSNLESEGFDVDYIEIADARTLETANGQSDKLIVLAAASINNIRLIDNLILN